MKVSTNWLDYKCISSGNGEKLECWKDVLLERPEPQAIWKITKSQSWDKAQGIYYRYKDGGGHWEFKEKLKDFWIINYGDLKFKVSPTNFKHLGLFPEQAVNWDYEMAKIKKASRDIKVLNLFAYTGAATMACSYAGAKEVVHVDSSKGMVLWAKENQHLCGLDNHKIRYIVDDCLKFVEREIRRGNKYDAIIMDPPSYGRGPDKEKWEFAKNLPYLVTCCTKLLSDNPLFFLINSYTTGISNKALYNLLKLSIPVKYKGKISSGEIGLPVIEEDLILPCGIYGLWEND